MIVCALGYGYLTKFVFKRICALGIKGIGVTSKNINNNQFSNITFVNRDKIKEVFHAYLDKLGKNKDKNRHDSKNRDRDRH